MDEKKIEELVESRIKEAFDKIEANIDGICKNPEKHSRRGSKFEFLGLLLVVIGLLFLADEMNWFRWDIPFWPVVLIALGLYFLLWRD